MNVDPRFLLAIESRGLLNSIYLQMKSEESHRIKSSNNLLEHMWIQALILAIHFLATMWNKDVDTLL